MELYECLHSPIHIHDVMRTNLPLPLPRFQIQCLQECSSFGSIHGCAVMTVQATVGSAQTVRSSCFLLHA